MSRLLILLLTAFAMSTLTALAEGQPEAAGSTIGYSTPAAALAALRARKDVTISLQGGWTLAVENASNTLWSFAPEGYPGYPAVVKRQVKEVSGNFYVKTDILCQGSKIDCDKLAAHFDKLNADIGKDFSK